MQSTKTKTFYVLPLLQEKIGIESNLPISIGQTLIDLCWYENQIGALAVFKDRKSVEKICEENGIDKNFIVDIRTISKNKEQIK